MTVFQWTALYAILGASFLGFLLLIVLGYISNHKLDKGEMRRAIAGFFILLFGLLVTASFFPIGVDLPVAIQGLFAGTITTLIGFYFGSRTSATQAGSDSDNGATPEAQPSGGSASSDAQPASDATNSEEQPSNPSPSS